MQTDMTALWISLKTASIATIITFFVGILVARWMANYQGKAKGLIDGVLILPMVLPPTVVGFLLLLLVGRNGPIGKFLAMFDYSIIFTWPATVLAATVVAFPLMYKTSRAAFEQIENTYLEAARTLGYTEWSIFWKIMLPMAWPGIAAGTILAFARALGEFGATLMLAGSIPGRTQTVPVAIFFAAEGGDMGRALLLVLIIIAISLFVVVLTHYFSRKEYSATGRVRM
ncbi:molybdate ABC transporter permease subunit [Desulfuribacillus alkaliarsenatis]|uniref:Molybdenum transport system permease n=1 Tax=Desulfuribacillus alkaliarsenatis TaxID=766136 RepID=A0A1E5FZL9_9FIRM|nr:molybdate ABC transporter permease subunit [Desulfuribacillus alkaliarsenatis]OEF95898.1 molybdenum ABC transporter permease subunit [Desulfuribacillus alkaliarsenatis]